MRKVYPHFIRLGEVHILRNIFLIYNSTESQINKVEVVKVESYSRNMKARDHRETKVHKEYKSDQVSHQLIITLVQHGAAEALFPLAIWLGAQVTSPAISLSLIPSLAASSGSAAEMSHRSPGQDNVVSCHKLTSCLGQYPRCTAEGAHASWGGRSLGTTCLGCLHQKGYSRVSTRAPCETHTWQFQHIAFQTFFSIKPDCEWSNLWIWLWWVIEKTRVLATCEGEISPKVPVSISQNWDKHLGL